METYLYHSPKTCWIFPKSASRWNRFLLLTVVDTEAGVKEKTPLPLYLSEAGSGWLVAGYFWECSASWTLDNFMTSIYILWSCLLIWAKPPMPITVLDSQWMCDKCLLKSFFFCLLKNGDTMLPLGWCTWHIPTWHTSLLYRNNCSGGSRRTNCMLGTG